MEDHRVAGDGLLLHAVEEAADVKLLLDEATPTVLVIEAAEDDDCGRLRSELSRDSRYAQTILVTIRDRLASHRCLGMVGGSRCKGRPTSGH